jgi:hypothetical protein
MYTQVLGAERTKTKSDEVAKKLPAEIWLKVLNYDVFELTYVNKFFQTLVKNNRNNICYNIIKNYNPNLNIVYEDSYTIYEFYCSYFVSKRFNPNIHKLSIYSILDIDYVDIKKIIHFLVNNNYYNCDMEDNEVIFRLAISYQNTEIIEYFIEKKLVNMDDAVYYNDILELILYEDSCIVLEYLMESGVIILDSKSKMNFKSIIESTFSGLKMDIITYLIKPNTSLHKSIFELIHEYDIDRDLKDEYIWYLKYLLLNNIRIVDDIDVDKYYEELYVNLRGLES